MKLSIKYLLFFVLISILISPGFSQSIPEPKEILGFEVGADYHLADYHQAMEYFKILEKNSNRIKLFDEGKTSMGQTMTYAVISSSENISQLEKYKQISKELALVKGITSQEAQKLSQEGKAVVYIDGGLHASECAPTQHNIQLAYNLVTTDDPKYLRILNDIILLLVFPNPDGMNLLAEWYRPHVGTPYEVSPMPRLYHKYAGHDNNRDSYMANLRETQNITRIVNQIWYPVLLYNHHQTAPFPARIWIPPHSEPTNPNVHPLIVRWQNMIGSAMGAAFDSQGKEGAISRIIYDTWYPGYVPQVVDSHNVISVLTETALYRYATPHFYTVHDFPEQYKDLTMSAFYPSPWKGGWWRIKDAIDYCLTASVAVLDVASRYKDRLLYNKYKMGYDIIERFKKEPPYAWIIPQQQKDPGTASLLLNRMMLLGIDVYKTTESFSCDGIFYPSGTYLIPMTQPFALFVKNVFEIQEYPDMRKYPDLWQGLINPKKFEGAPYKSYDMTGWTLPFQCGVEVHSANTPIQPSMESVPKVHFQKGEIKGKPGYGYILPHDENASFIAMNRILKTEGQVFWTKSSFSSGGKTYPPGTIVIPSQKINRSLIEKLSQELDLIIIGINRRPQVQTLPIKSPRTGMYKSWDPTPPEGWTRWIFEKFEFPYTILHDADIKAGKLNQNYDVIIIPDTYESEIVLHGHEKGTMPPKYTGGITLEGLRNLREFAQKGGTLIFFNRACNLATDYFNIPVRNVIKGAKREEFMCSGAILRMNFDNQHPIAYGMPKEAGSVFAESCAFEILPSFEKNKKPQSVATYPEDDLLMSGWIHGSSIIQQKNSILEVPYGKGKIILLGFPVQYRAQPYLTFKLLFNSMLYPNSKN